MNLISQATLAGFTILLYETFGTVMALYLIKLTSCYYYFNVVVLQDVIHEGGIPRLAILISCA